MKKIGDKAGITFHTDDKVDGAPTVVFVGGGGVEGNFKRALPELKDPIVILTSGENNSLAASMEILSYLKNEGRNYIGSNIVGSKWLEMDHEQTHSART